MIYADLKVGMTLRLERHDKRVVTKAIRRFEESNGRIYLYFKGDSKRVRALPGKRTGHLVAYDYAWRGRTQRGKILGVAPAAEGPSQATVAKFSVHADAAEWISGYVSETLTQGTWTGPAGDRAQAEMTELATRLDAHTGGVMEFSDADLAILDQVMGPYMDSGAWDPDPDYGPSKRLSRSLGAVYRRVRAAALKTETKED